MRLRKEYAHPLGDLPKLHVLDPIEHRHGTPTFEEPHLHQVPHHRTKPDFHRIELVSHVRSPLGRGPMSPPHSGPRPEFLGLHALRRLSGADLAPVGFRLAPTGLARGFRASRQPVKLTTSINALMKTAATCGTIALPAPRRRATRPGSPSTRGSRPGLIRRVFPSAQGIQMALCHGPFGSKIE